MKPKLYLETTIPSYLTSRPSKNVVVAGHQKITHAWWKNRRQDFLICISQFVLDEISLGDSVLASKRATIVKSLDILEVNDAVTHLAERFLASKVVPKKAAADAAHIAIAAVHNMNYLMTWNCTHIANAEMSVKIKHVCEKSGYSTPVICTPEELMGGI
jgi:hypothetical protein